LNNIKSNENRIGAERRSAIYSMLAAVYRQELSSELLRQIKDPRFMGVLSDLGAEPMDDFFQKPEEKLLDELAVEYTRLFLGPGKHISPHESVHHQRSDGDWGKIWGAATVEVKKFIEATGLSFGDDYKGMPDHISVELEFMQQVTLREEQAWGEEDEEGALYCTKIEKKFIEEHLIHWIPIFCEKIIQDTELHFYREMAALTRNFIELEKKEINCV